MRPLIPPVGYPVCMQPGGDGGNAVQQFAGYDEVLLASGTAALAAAMRIASIDRGNPARGEVILPAYGCPDLVAAAVFAGLQPVLVDIEPAFHGYALDPLRAAITEDTVAVVAVNLLGVRERLNEITSVLNSAPAAVALIEDDAQWLPEPGDDAAELRGDFVVNSFGRGKPASLLGGGRLLFRRRYAGHAAQLDVGVTPQQGVRTRLSTFAYNRLLHPFCYRLVSALPMLNIGATVYHELPALAAMNGLQQSWLEANVRRYLQRSRDGERRLTDALAGHAQFVDLAATAPAGYGRLLRYPLQLRDPESRDDWLQRFNAAGFGATAMYQQPLAAIDGVGPRVQLRGTTANAGHYAAGLLTLPLQAGMGAAAIARMLAILG